MIPSEETLREILGWKTIAVVGLSPNPGRPSHAVAGYLLRAGYSVIPVNPGHREILGRRAYPNLLEVPEKIDVVNIFRRPEHVYPIVQDAVRVGARAVWMQDGIEHPLAAEVAQRAGLKVVMDDCLMREHQRLLGPFGRTVPTC